MLVLLAGLGTGLSLIVAIGAQNAFVLRQGLKGEHLPLVLALCLGSDLLLITAGVGGLGTLIASVPALLTIIRWVGVAFLATYGVLAARRALRRSVLVTGRDGGPSGVKAVVLATLAFTWLNPHTYLDTVLLIGSISATHGDQRWLFGAGALIASAIWFVSLGVGSRMLAPVFAKPVAWRVLDVSVAVIMFALAATIALTPLGGTAG